MQLPRKRRLRFSMSTRDVSPNCGKKRLLKKVPRAKKRRKSSWRVSSKSSPNKTTKSKRKTKRKGCSKKCPERKNVEKALGESRANHRRTKRRNRSAKPKEKVAQKSAQSEKTSKKLLESLEQIIAEQNDEIEAQNQKRKEELENQENYIAGEKDLQKVRDLLHTVEYRKKQHAEVLQAREDRLEAG